ncbi:MAG: 2-oxoacid:acceptor oxidoreductase family protein [Desulfopila sp.]
MKRVRLVFSGSGGQGVITAAIILAEAAVVQENRNATQSQSYGAAARGGATRSDVIISDAEIDFPVVSQPNILICLTQEAYSSFGPEIRPGGILLADPRFVKTIRKVDAQQVELPMYDMVMQEIGKPIVFNICVLGALIGLREDLVQPESIMATIGERVPKDFIAMNRESLQVGLELGRSFGADR